MSDEAMEHCLKDDLSQLGIRYLLRTAEEVAAVQAFLEETHGAGPVAVDSVAKMAHRVHGSSAMLGFRAVGDCARLLNEFVRGHGAMALDEDEYHYVKRQVDRLAGAVQDALKGQRAAPGQTV